MRSWIIILFVSVTFGKKREETLVCFPQIEISSPYTPFDFHSLSHPPKLISYQETSSDKPQLDYNSRVDVKVQYEEVVVEKRRKECETKKGIYLNPYCYKFIYPELTFEEAKIFCATIGGSLWVPDLTDPDLFGKLASSFHEVFGATRNTVWMGIMLTSKRFMTLDGDDVTNTYLGQIGEKSERKGSCVAAHLRTGVVLHGVNCSCASDFVCELPLTSLDERVTKKVLKYVYDV